MYSMQIMQQVVLHYQKIEVVTHFQEHQQHTTSIGFQ